MKPVAVLGVGPAGLLAAWALARQGQMIALFGAPAKDGDGPAKSVIGGAQFLHEAIPGLHDAQPDAFVTMLGEGDADTYRTKVYGDQSVPFVSFRHDMEAVKAWKMQETYDRLWDLLGAERANVDTITPDWLDEAKQAGHFSAVVSSIPAPFLCRSGHVFTSQEIRVLDRCMTDVPRNTVLYDGTEDRSWYRSSNLFGVESTEWSIYAPEPMLEEEEELVSLSKPIFTNCTCFPDVMRVGRMGLWKKGVLAHHAYVDVLDAL